MTSPYCLYATRTDVRLLYRRDEADQPHGKPCPEDHGCVKHGDARFDIARVKNERHETVKPLRRGQAGQYEGIAKGLCFFLIMPSTDDPAIERPIAEPMPERPTMRARPVVATIVSIFSSLICQ